MARLITHYHEFDLVRSGPAASNLDVDVIYIPPLIRKARLSEIAWRSPIIWLLRYKRPAAMISTETDADERSKEETEGCDPGAKILF
jgi:hypothetical protein